MTDPLFHVFIERARSTAPGAAAELARAIAARYGIPAAELEKRFAMGRFRVKGNVDRATADSYLADLASLGAVCTIIAASAAAPPVAAVTPAPVAPPVVAPVMTLPAQPRVPAPAPMTRAMEDSFGALSGEHPLTLSTLDGASEDEARSSRKIAIVPRESAQASREPSRDAPLPASFGPPSDSSDPGRDAARSSSRAIAEPIEFMEGAAFDPFAPPEMQSEEPELTLAVERKPRVSNAPPPPEPEAAPVPRVGKTATLAPEPRGSRSASVPLPASASAPPPRSAGAPAGLQVALRDEGSRFVIGVVLAVALGAVPALLIASAREHSAFTRLDAGLERTQDEADTPDAWDRLDRARASVLSRKHDERQNIVITSLLLWAVISGGLAWLWFRAIDWDRRTR